MSPIQQIRLVADRGRTSPMIDAVTAGTPEFFCGTDVQFAFAVLRDDVLQDISELATVTLEVKRRDARVAPAYMSKTISAGELTVGLTQAAWDEGTGAHGVISFTAAETSLDLAGGDEATYHLVLSATTGTGQKVTLGISVLRIIEDGTPSGLPVPPLIAADYYTKGESDARFLTAYDESAQDAAIAAKIPLTQKNAPNGVAPLDADGKVPVANLPAAGGPFIPTSAKGASGGVASLGTNSKVPVAQLPVGTANGVAPLGSDGKVPSVNLPPALTGDFIPTSQKAANSGVAPLDSTGKVPSVHLPAVVGGPFVPVSAVGVATGVASLGTDGKVPPAQLPAGMALASYEGIITLKTFDDPLPDVDATPAFKNYLLIRRGTSLVTVPAISDELMFWNEGDGIPGGIRRWQPVWQATRIPLPLIDVGYNTNNTVGVAAWPSAGSSAQVVTRITINGADPTINDSASPVFPERYLYTPATHGVSWTDGSGTHYRFVVKARAFGPGLPQTSVVTKTFSVNVDGSFYSDY